MNLWVQVEMVGKKNDGEKHMMHADGVNNIESSKNELPEPKVGKFKYKIKGFCIKDNCVRKIGC